MLKPSKKIQIEVSNLEQARIAEINKKNVSIISLARKRIKEAIKRISNARKPSVHYKAIEDYIVKNYGVMFKDMKYLIVDALNQSGIEQRMLIDDTLNKSYEWEAYPIYKTLPKTEAFKITNRILSERSYLKRNKILAKRVTKIISKGFDAGNSISAIQKNIDIELGFRDKQGKITSKSLKLIKQGKFSHTNGHIYQTYRIARTEAMRMASIQANNVYSLIDIPTKRLQMIAKIDARTRAQSRQMNRQLSRKDGKFKYPNGGYYFHGTAPARWSVNDRETTITVFLKDIDK